MVATGMEVSVVVISGEDVTSYGAVPIDKLKLLSMVTLSRIKYRFLMRIQLQNILYTVCFAKIQFTSHEEEHLKHVLAKVDKWHFSKNELFVFFKLFTKNVLAEKKVSCIFTNFLVINSL